MSHGAYRLAGALGLAAVAALAGRRGSGTQGPMSAQQTANLKAKVRELFASKDRANIQAALELWKALGGGEALPLQRLELSWAKLSGADLTGADLTGADLTGANLRKANLTGADLTGTNLRLTNLWKANLIGADLTKAYLTKADLRLTNLWKANLEEADLTGANLRGAKLRGAKYDASTLWPDGFRVPSVAVLVG